MQQEQSRSGGILNIEFKSKTDLYKSYMSFVKNGGLFIPTVKKFVIGDELFVVLGLPEETEKTPIACRVVWLTPVGAQGNRTPGIGVRFGDDGAARTKIENSLAGLLKSDQPTLSL